MKKCNLENVDCHATLAMAKNMQSGRSMIEMLGVLAIIGVLSVGGIAGYSKAMQKYRINKAIEQITLIAGNIRSFFAPQRNYVGASCYNCSSSSGCTGTAGNDGCPVIKKAKILPDEMITLNDDGKITAITNPFGGVSLWVENKSTGGDDQAFRINYGIGDNVEACIELLSYDWTTANVSIIGFASNGPAGGGKIKLPISLDEAVSQCSSYISEAKSYGGGGLVFYFDVNLKGDAWKNTTWLNS